MINDTQEIGSPCLNICKLDVTQTLCLGCYRTTAEIGEWSRANNDRKQDIINLAASRKRQTEN